MEIPLNLLLNRTPGSRQETSQNSGAPVAARVVEVREDGSVVLEINRQTVTVQLEGGTLSEGQKVMVQFMKDASGRLSLQITDPNNGAMARGITVSSSSGTGTVPLQADARVALFSVLDGAGEKAQADLLRLYHELEQLSVPLSEQEAEPLQRMRLLLRTALEETLQTIRSEASPVSTPMLAKADLPLLPFYRNALSVLVRTEGALQTLPLPVQVKMAEVTTALEKVVQTLLLQQEESLPVLRLLSAPPDTPSFLLGARLQGSVTHAPVSPGSVEICLPDQTVLRLASSLTFMPGERLTLLLRPDQQMPVAANEPVGVADAFPVALLPRPGLEFIMVRQQAPRLPEMGLRVFHEAQDMDLVSRETTQLPSNLFPVAERLAQLQQNASFTFPEEKALIRSFLLLQSKGIPPERVLPELGLHRSLTQLTALLKETLAAVLAEPSFQMSGGPSSSLMELLKPLAEFALLEHDESGRGEVLRRFFENSGLFLENKLLKGGRNPSLLSDSMRSDLKAALLKLADGLQRADLPPETHARLEGQVARLLNMIEALQVRNLADGLGYHFIIPLAKEGMPQNAVVTFHRRKGRRKVDKDNTGLRIRVALSALGEVDARVQIRNNVVWLAFFLEHGRFISLLSEGWEELKSRLTAIGYLIGRFQAAQKSEATDAADRENPFSEEAKGRGAGLDLTA